MLSDLRIKNFLPHLSRQYALARTLFSGNKKCIKRARPFTGSIGGVKKFPVPGLGRSPSQLCESAPTKIRQVSSILQCLSRICRICPIFRMSSQVRMPTIYIFNVSCKRCTYNYIGCTHRYIRATRTYMCVSR